MTIVGEAVALALGMIALGAAAKRGWRKWVSPKINHLRAAWHGVFGREEKRDSITGEVIQPALPSVGMRMASQERATEVLTVTLQKAVDQQAAYVNLSEKVEQHDIVLVDHSNRIVKLEGRNG